MKKAFLASFLIGIIFFVAGCICDGKVILPLPESTDITPIENPYKESIPLTDSQKKEDLFYLYDNLVKKHKNLFFNHSKEEFQLKRDEILERISSLSDHEFYFELQEFTALVGDGHTRLYLDDRRVFKYDFQSFLPFSIIKFEDGWRLMICEPEYKEYLGWKLIAINAIEIEAVFKRTLPLISNDTEAWAQGRFSGTISFIDTLNYLEISNNFKSINLMLQGDAGQEIEIICYAKNAEEIMDVKLVKFQASNRETQTNDRMYSVRELKDGILFIQYNECYEEEKYPIIDFTEDLRAQMEGEVYKKVIIDLRHNLGGNASIWDPVTELLESQIREKGLSLYILIGRDTFDTAVGNAIDLQRIGGLLVGTPTGGSVNSYGEIKYFYLPNLPAEVSYSTNYFERIEKYENDSLYPDIVVKQDFEHYQTGIDSELEVIRKLPE